jgi:hypothetical protein
MGVGERRRTVIAEDQVEGRLCERQLLGIPAHQREARSPSRDVRAGVTQLVLREVDADHTGTARGDAQSELRAAAPELERVETVDVPERVDIALRHVPDAPRQDLAVELLAVAGLVRVTVVLPRCQVDPNVIPAHRSSLLADAFGRAAICVGAELANISGSA